MNDAAARMKKLRKRRNEADIKEHRLWIKKEVYEEIKDILKAIELLSLEDERKKALKDLKNNLHEKLQKYKTWENYYSARYDMPSKSLSDLISTEKQRKFAYVIGRAINKPLPNNFILSNRSLLREWISEQIHKHNIEHIYNWEEIAENNLDQDPKNSLPA